MDQLFSLVLPTTLGALAAFLLGIVWYHPSMFGDQIKAFHIRVKKETNKAVMPIALCLFLWIVASFFFGFIATSLSITTFGGLFSLACMFWIAFALPPIVMSTIFIEPDMEVLAINSAYQLAGYYGIAVICYFFVRAGTLV